MKSIFQKKRFYIFLAFFGFITYAYRILELRMDENQYQKVIPKHIVYPLNAVNYEADGKQMRYIEIGNPDLPMVLLIHGAPSSSLSWQSLLGDSSVLSKAYLVAVDRPGYGYSSFGEVETSVITQAEKIIPILEKKRQQHDKILVLGSSYGGPVAVAIAGMRPDLVDAVMLQSSSMEPGAEKIYPISYPTSHPSIKWMVPTVFRNANTEKLTHRAALEELLPYWKNIIDPVVIFHGMADDLIYFSNAQFAQKQLVNAPFVDLKAQEDKGHGMLWSDYDLVRSTIKETVSKMASGVWQQELTEKAE